MPFVVRSASPADFDVILPRTRALNAHEGIAIGDAALASALRHLLATPAIGSAFVLEDVAPIEPRQPSVALPARVPSRSIGYAIVTFGYDLEFGGRDAYLTELWIDEPHRGRGAATAALAQLPNPLRAHGVHALHLQVRPDNPALRLYERVGFVRSPRYVMTRRL